MDSRSTLVSLRFLAPVATLAIAAALAGCGSLGQLPGRVEQPQVVTAEDIHRYPEGSPVRTVLQWWRALQFGNAELAARYYSPKLGLTPRKLEQALVVGPGGRILGVTAGLRVVDVEKWGRRATVLAFLTKEFRYPNGRTDKTSSTASFNVVRQGGRWFLADNSYLDRIFQTVKKFIEEGTAKK
jgi:hypothetical protein